MNIQFKKRSFRIMCTFSPPKTRLYGYELVEHISKYINISEGTIYPPLLRKFRTEGYVTNYLKESQEGPPRNTIN